MLKLKSYKESPSGGFPFLDKSTGWRTHSWSFNATVAAWFQECQRRKTSHTLKRCQVEVEEYVCEELMKTVAWENWVRIEDNSPPYDWSTADFAREDSSPLTKDRFIVVFPFCIRDSHLAMKQMKWVAELGPYEHTCLLSYDHFTSPGVIEKIEQSARSCFPVVHKFSYSAPRPEHWPPTIAFKSCALHMETLGHSWLWMESDAVPMRKGWLEKLQSVYWASGKAFSGPIVADMGHMNGTGIYPVNTPKRIPGALSQLRTAWDVTMKHEMIHDCHNLHPYLFHCWGVYDGKLHPYLGEPPVFRDHSLMSQIHPEAVLFHRDKSLSLIDRIKEKVVA